MATTKKTTKKTSRAKKAVAARKPASAKKEPTAGKAKRTAATIDRRATVDRRKTRDRRKKQEPVAVDYRTLQRRVKVNRRRQIDPTTCERDYTPEEIEFMNALDRYKRSSGRMFPTSSEVLEVLKMLGYQKPSRADLAESAAGPAAVPILELPTGQVPEQTAV